MIAVILILISLILFTLMILTLRIDRVQDSVDQLDEKFIKLQKDAIKVTFNEDPIGIRTTPTDVKKILNSKPLIEGDSKSQTKGVTGITEAAPPRPISANPKVLGEWQTKNGTPKIMGHKKNPKK